MTGTAPHRKVVDPDLYSRDYFLSDNEGWREYMLDLDGHVHPKFARALELAPPGEGDSVLDIGCGRGELVYYSAKRGARALGLDYSPDAVKIANETIARLPGHLRGLAKAQVGEASDLPFIGRFTIVFMIETFEHMHDWQLERSFGRIRDALAEGGRLVIITPNCYYERILSPLKRLLNLPLNLARLPFRLFKTKYRQYGAAALVRKAFRIWPDRGELNRAMHVNVATPAKVRRLLSGFEASVWCEDGSRNPLSLLTKRWWGRDIVAVATKR